MRKNGRERRLWKLVQSPTSGCGAATRRGRWSRGSRRCDPRSIHTMRCMCTASTTLGLLGWLFACSARSADEDRNGDDGDNGHGERGKLCLSKAEDDGRVGAEITEPEAADAV